MPDLLPIFPLQNVVLFPNVFLPLHIFEPRYREMVADAAAADRLLGIVLLQPGWEADYEGRPPVYPVGCSGVITHMERLDDGRYNIVLRGLERFRIISEDEGRRYRRARVERLVECEPPANERALIHQRRIRLERLLAPIVERAGSDPTFTTSMADEDLVHALAQHLDLEPIEKLAVLERDCLLRRAESLIELLEMKVLMSRTPGAPTIAH